MAPALQKVRDYLTMRAEAERARRVPVDEKAALARASSGVREARRAAEVLWSGACPAFAWRTAKGAFEEAIEAARTAVGAEPIDEVTKTLGLSEKIAAKVKRADADCASLAAPAVDAEIVAAHVDAFENVREAILALERALVPFASDDKTMRRLQLRRQIVTALLAIVVLASIVFVIRMQFRTWATASAMYGPKYDPMAVLDHSPEGEWLLPNGTPGWIDVHYAPSRTVTRVHILNSHNIPYWDRATKDFTLELYAGNKLLKSVDGTFPNFDPEPTPQTIDVGRTTGVDRLRVVVKTWHLQGGGLAEISVD
jgi:hypothetical protein